MRDLPNRKQRRGCRYFLVSFVEVDGLLKLVPSLANSHFNWCIMDGSLPVAKSETVRCQNCQMFIDALELYSAKLYSALLLIFDLDWSCSTDCNYGCDFTTEQPSRDILHFPMIDSVKPSHYL